MTAADHATAVTAPSTDPAYGLRILTLEEQRRLIAVSEAARGVWDYSYSRDGEIDLLVPRPEMLALGRALDARGGAR